jgi:tetrapyrrole methylase family protein/MazG family protein
MKRGNLKELVSIMERLRGPKGCPWDREQTTESLIPFVIEEAYEVAAAIDSRDPKSIKEELGDLLFQIIFLCQLAKERREFDISDVIESSCTKMVRRHPHVFGEKKAETSKEVLSQWAAIKEEEKKKEEGYLSELPEAFPALMRAHRVTEKAAKIGFDWENVDQVLEKLNEELNEFRQALSARDAKSIEEELGDLIFALVNISRFVEVNPEEALRKTIGRFINRFHYIEKRLEEEGKELSGTPLEEMERLWNEAKSCGRQLEK